MFKSTKSKVIAGALSLTIVASAGTAFAAPNAGKQLKIWAAQAVTTAYVQMIDDFNGYWDSAMSQFNKDKNKVKRQTVAAVAAKGDAVTTNSTVAVDNYADKYINQIDNAQADLEAVIPPTITLSTQIIESMQNQIINDTAEKYQNNINKAVETQTTTSITDMTTAVTAEQDAKVQELTERIAQAKAELNDLIASNIKDANDHMQANLTERIAQKETEIADATKELKQAKFELIRTTGQQLVANAKDALDAVVNGIQNDDVAVSADVAAALAQ